MKQLTITDNDFNKICRLCLACDATMTGVFWFSSKLGKEIADIIMECTPIQITKNDEMPTCICQLCYNKLDEIHQFQIQAVQSEETLRRYIRRVHSSENQNKLEDFGVNITVKSESSEKNDKFNADINRKKLSSDFPNTENKIIEGTLLKSEEIVYKNINIAPSATEVIPHQCKYFSEEQSQCCTQNSSEDLGNQKSHINVDITVKSEPLEMNDEHFSQWKLEIPKIPNALKLNYTNEEFPIQFEELCKVQFKEESNVQLNFTDLNTHLYSSDGFETTTADTEIDINKKTVINNKSHQCDVCKKCFKQLGYLKKHNLIHTGEKPYQCDICKQCFRELNHLKRHKFTHTGEKPYQCDVCKVCFTQAGHLKSHKLKHTGEKPYQCDICQKCFREYNNLKRHKLVHTGEKPFQCDVCTMCFTQAGHLKSHKLKHTGEKPYQCDVCKKSFGELNNLKRHKLTHTGERPYQCDFCKMCFTQAVHLKSHISKHTGEKPYQCDVCKMCFRHLKSLKTHKVKHTSEKPY